MASFQHGSIDLAHLGNYYFLKQTIKTYVSFYTTLSKYELWQQNTETSFVNLYINSK